MATTKTKTRQTAEERREAMGHAYVELLNDRTALLAQMHNYTACEDPEICAVVRKGFGKLVQFVEKTSGADPDTVRMFFATGMLLNVVAAMNLPELDEPWVHRLLPPKMADQV